MLWLRGLLLEILLCQIKDSLQKSHKWFAYKAVEVALVIYHPDLNLYLSFAWTGISPDEGQ